jgi:hypothetical protein
MEFERTTRDEGSVVDRRCRSISGGGIETESDPVDWIGRRMNAIACSAISEVDASSAVLAGPDSVKFLVAPDEDG